MKLHRGLGITQKAAWHLLHKIRFAMDNDNGLLFGTVEVNETFIGGLEKNKHADKKLHAGRGGVGKSIVIGMKDREANLVAAKVIKNTNSQPCMNLFRKMQNRALQSLGMTSKATRISKVMITSSSSIRSVNMYGSKLTLMASNRSGQCSSEHTKEHIIESARSTSIDM